ncbi:MAG: UbiX family flavin prenyltransferase [Rhodocyclaceae bacterium]|nr:UbiX family flavin prenyltransferase [Rhodocyclaceae bacterium]
MTLASPPRRVVVAWSGASGIGYGLRLVEVLLAAGLRVELVYSAVTQVVARQELDLALPAAPDAAAALLRERFGAGAALQVYGREAWFAPIASGSNAADAMVVCPCSMGTLAAIAQGLAKNLIERAADVMLKERRPLVLVPRETPLSAIHLENMLRLARAGACVLPANPGFYHRPQRVEDLIDFVVMRICDQIGVETGLLTRWGETPEAD